MATVMGYGGACPDYTVGDARPGATLLDHDVIVVVFQKQGLYMYALQARSGPG